MLATRYSDPMPEATLPPISRASLAWSIPYHEAYWHRLANAALTTPAPIGVAENDVEPDVHVQIGPALPKDASQRIAVVVAVLSRTRGQISCFLQLSPHPEGPPPPHIEEASRRVGGLEGLRELLIAQPNSTLVCATTMRLDLSGESWRCPALEAKSLAVDAPFSSLGASATREELGYRLYDGVGGLSEISIVYDHDLATFFLNITATLAIRWADDSWLAPDRQLASLVVSALFSPRED